jgi:hydroxymethylbilane synthase
VPGRTLIAGTRGSRLALRQTEIVLAALREKRPALSVEVREIRTEGDRDQRTSLAVIGGQGVFVRALEDALLAGEIDFAVHSLKDVPAETAEGLTIGAVPERDDPRDVLVTRDGATLAELSDAPSIGTSSQRRSVQLRALREDVQPIDIRGNVDTRVRKVDDGQYDGAVLAAAGLKRLGMLERASEVFDPAVFLPAAGQGSLAVEAREGDGDVIDLLLAIDDAAAHAASDAERAFLQRIGGGCRLPFGVLAEVAKDQLRIRGFMSDDGGSESVRAEKIGPCTDAKGLGMGLADALLEQGGSRFLDVPA